MGKKKTYKVTMTDEAFEALSKLMEHTPEPWFINPYSGTEVQMDEGHGADLYFLSENMAKANARRIVTAVHACVGIPNEALKEGIVGEFIEALRAAQELFKVFSEPVSEDEGRSVFDLAWNEYEVVHPDQINDVCDQVADVLNKVGEDA